MNTQADLFLLTTYGTTAMFIASKSSPVIKNLFVEFVSNKGKVKGMASMDVRVIQIHFHVAQAGSSVFLCSISSTCHVYSF
jgi:hypothetical protein